eukprot:jgi/Undpi1/692/HiC_scaffold_10.g04156.m1
MEPARSNVVTNDPPAAGEPSEKSSNVVATIHKMTEEDMETALGWAKTEHWNPGCGDAKPFFASDPEGCFISKTEDDEPVATIMGIRYGEDYGFIGLYICAPQYRGQGHGLAVFNHAMRHLAGRVVGLEAVEVQQGNYRKQGFEVAHQTLRYCGVVGKIDAPPFSTPSANEGEKTVVAVVVEKLREDSVEQVLDFDASHVPAPRTQFMRMWLANPGHTTLVATENGSVTGYGVLRPSDEGARIGPLFANSTKVADLLMRGLAESTSPTTSIAIDIPEPNDDAIRLIEHLGFSKAVAFARMYKGPAPKLPLERVYAVSLVELG